MMTTTMQRFSQLTASIAGMSLPQHSSSRRKGTTTGFSLIFDEYDQSYRYNNNYQTHYVLPTEAFIMMERERTADFSFTTHCDDEDDEEDEEDDDDVETTLVVNDDETDDNNKDKDRYIVIATKDILEVTPLVERTNNTDDAAAADDNADDDSCVSFDTFSSCPSAEVVRAAAVVSSATSEVEKDEQPQQHQLRASSSSRSNSTSNTSRDNHKIALTTTNSLSNLKSTMRMSISASRRRTGSNKNATTNDKSFGTAATKELSFIVDDKDNDEKDNDDDCNCSTVLPTEAFITMERVRSKDFSYDDTTTVASYDLTYNNNDENDDAIISVFILDTIHANTVQDGDDGDGESDSDNDEAVSSSYDQQCPYYHQESIETIDGATTNTLATTKYGDDVVRHCSFLASSALIVVSLSLSCIEFEEV